MFTAHFVAYLSSLHEDRPQYNLSLIFFNAKLSLRDNGLIVFMNFSFSSGCDLHDNYITWKLEFHHKIDTSRTKASSFKR